MSKLTGLLAASLVLAVAAPGAARAEGSDARLTCPSPYSTFQISLPSSGSARYSMFFYRLNGGGWMRTSWYYTQPLPSDSYAYDEGTRRWSVVPFGNEPLVATVGANVLVEAYEWRHTTTGTWIHLGSCRTSGYSGGIVFGP